jgi:tetratricopeptide (TPR) repeat protein
MARIFHPDAKPALYKGDVRDKVEALFTKIGEAYSTIIDPEFKKQYVEKLKSTVSDAEMEKANRVIQAEMEMQKGVIAIRRGSFKEAAAALEDAIKLVPDEPEFKIYMGYAQFKVQGVASAGKYAKMIEEALKQRPKVAEGWFFLGVIYRVNGELEKARDYFNKALELDKYHQDSQRELRVIEMKLAEAPKKGKKK